MLKKILSLFIISSLILTFIPNFCFAQDYSCGGDSKFPSIKAPNLLMIDDEGFVYLKRDSSNPVKIASLTKIMTAICTFELLSEGYANFCDIFTVSQNAAKVGESASGLKQGDELSLYDTIIGMLVSSGNDASVVLAENLNYAASQYLNKEEYDIQIEKNVKPYYKDFVQLMNFMSEKLELEDSLFENPHGLDFDEFEGDLHSTANDVVKMAQYAMSNSDFANIVKMRKAELNIIRNGSTVKHQLSSTNILIELYEGVCGVKTGFTEAAGNCFCGAIDFGGTRLYSVVLGCSSLEQRFRDTTSLYNWYYKHLYEVKLCDTKNKFDKKKVLAYLPNFEWLNKRYAASIADDKKSIKIFEFKGDIYQDIILYDNVGDIKKDQLVGQVVYKQGDKVIANEDLFALEDSKAPPDLLSKIGICLSQVALGITGRPFFAEVQSNNKLMFS